MRRRRAAVGRRARGRHGGQAWRRRVRHHPGEHENAGSRGVNGGADPEFQLLKILFVVGIIQ